MRAFKKVIDIAVQEWLKVGTLAVESFILFGFERSSAYHRDFTF